MSLQARYTIRRKIADGGTAEIFLATQVGAHGFEKQVVLKRIFTAFYADPQFRNMLVDEAHIAMSLNHSNIVQVLDLGESEGQYFLALELVDGWPLDAVLRRVQALGASIPPPIALYLTAEVCRALAYAHGKTGPDGRNLGIVHRDISPHNVLLSEQGEVKITDFGIAKSHSRREKSLGNLIKGKIAFMSPEQASGEAMDGRSDLYSLGTILYVMVTRRYPYDAPTDYETLLLVKNGQYASPETVRPGLNPELYRVIKRAMSKRLDERYQRAEDMLVDVEQVMRLAFRAVGQTELKRWLADLSTRDGVLPLTKQGQGASGAVPGSPHESAVQSANSRPNVPGRRPTPPPPPPPLPARPPRRTPDPTVVDPPIPGAAPREDLKEIRTEDLTLEPVLEDPSRVARPRTEDAAPTEVMALPAPEAHAAADPAPAPLASAPSARLAATAPEPRPQGPASARKAGLSRGIGVAVVALVALVAGAVALRSRGSHEANGESRAARADAPQASSPTATAADKDVSPVAAPSPPPPASGPPSAAAVPAARSPDPAPAAADKGGHAESHPAAPVVPPVAAPAGPLAAGEARSMADAATPAAPAKAEPPGVPTHVADSPPVDAPTGTAGSPETGGADGADEDDADEAGGGEPASPELFSVVTLRSTPMGAAVHRGKKPLGVTPVTVRLKKGRWIQLQLTKDGYSPLTKKIRIGPTPTQRFNLALRKLPPPPSSAGKTDKKADDAAGRKWWQVWR